MFNRECLIKNTWNRDYKKENISFSSSSSSIETLNQTILFLSKGKIFKKILNWIEIGRGECEIIEDNQSGDKFYIQLTFLKEIQVNNFFDFG